MPDGNGSRASGANAGASLGTPDLDAAVGAGEIEIAPPGELDAPSAGSAASTVASEIEGVALVRLSPITDDRGSLTEVLDLEHPFWAEPVVYAYRITIRPGRIKGWGMHKLQADRYLVESACLRVILFDGRQGSPSFGALNEFHFGEGGPGLLRIPPGVWHADHNYGTDEASILNFPTRPYNHADPDKYRIDPHRGEIPFDWGLRDR